MSAEHPNAADTECETDTLLRTVRDRGGRTAVFTMETREGSKKAVMVVQQRAGVLHRQAACHVHARGQHPQALVPEFNPGEVDLGGATPVRSYSLRRRAARVFGLP
jgi:hypothetical protein